MQYGYDTCDQFLDEFFDLSDDEKKRREADVPRRVAEWAAGGVHYGDDEFLPLTNQAETPTTQR